ncbi:MAG: hypothetical protein JO276_13815 [Sphingomonadaceae bacterium]|nr:hypothetical protein [Sphingomonadaceae bacterium]
MRKAVLLTGVILSCISPAAAQTQLTPAPIIYGPPGPSLPLRVTPGYTRLIAELRGLREEALALRESDGGRLTTEHRDFIQARIDAAYRRFDDTRLHRRPSRS